MHHSKSNLYSRMVVLECRALETERIGAVKKGQGSRKESERAINSSAQEATKI